MMMEPDTKIVMAALIKEVRQKIPFNLSLNSDCEGRCDMCPFKRLEFLDMELSGWEERLKRGESPSPKDVEDVSRNYHEVYAILKKERLLKEP